jgi:hypothetical protein
MRKAAGIMMVIYGVQAIGFLGGFLSEQGTEIYEINPLALSLGVIISAVFIITGGVFCLKRKHWKLCFASSLFSLLFMMCEFCYLPPLLFMMCEFYYLPPFKIWFDTYLLLPLGALPLIFVCLRKSEWQEFSA